MKAAGGRRGSGRDGTTSLINEQRQRTNEEKREINCFICADGGGLADVGTAVDSAASFN